MDLGTMLRKAKAHVYKSKAEFAADLNLIWNNCLTYNTDPVSLYDLWCVGPIMTAAPIEPSATTSHSLHAEEGSHSSRKVDG
jgi:hypothetical protein